MKDVLPLYAFIAGVAFIAASIWMMSLPGIFAMKPSLGFQAFLLYSTLVILIGSLVVHISAYIYIGKKYSSRAIIFSTIGCIAGCLLFGIALLLAVGAGISSSASVHFLNALVGFSVTILAIPSLVLAISFFRLYQELGISSFAAAIIVPVSIFAIWKPWPAALVMAVSMYFLRQVSKR